MAESKRQARTPARAIALRFVLMIGVVSFFADFAYEGSRSITGPFLATLDGSDSEFGIGLLLCAH